MDSENSSRFQFVAEVFQTSIPNSFTHPKKNSCLKELFKNKRICKISLQFLVVILRRHRSYHPGPG